MNYVLEFDPDSDIDPIELEKAFMEATKNGTQIGGKVLDPTFGGISGKSYTLSRQVPCPAA